MRTRMLWALPAMMAAVAACSSSSSSGGATVTAAQACTDLGTSICNKLESCAPFLMTTTYGDAATCATRLQTTCPGTLTANGSGATPAAVEACAQAYQASSCDDLLSNNTPSACQIQGTLTAGTACGDDTQCAGTNAYCNIATGQACGVCGTRAAAGAACTGGNKACQYGLVCATQAGTTGGLCVTPGAQGAACDSSHPCKTTLTCFNKTCAVPAQAGQACDSIAQNCDFSHGLFCNPQSKVCATIATAAAGGPCGYSASNNTYTACTGGATCPLTGTSAAGTCQAAAADGAACSTTNGPGCEQPAVCTNNACALPNASSCK